MTLTKYYKNAVLIPSGLVFAGYLIFALIDGWFGEAYQSEFMTKGAVLFMTILMVAVNSLFICLLTIPLFLNQYNNVKQNFILSTLAWFLLPMIWIIYLLIKNIHYIVNYSHEFDGESIFVFSNTLPYVIGLGLTFIKFRHRIKADIEK